MRSRLYSFCVFVVGAILALLVLRANAPPDWRLVLVFCLASVVVEAYAFRMPEGGTTSLLYTVVVAALLLGGPVAGAMVAVAGAVPVQDVRDRKAPHLMLFNVSQLLIAAILAGLMYSSLGGTPIFRSGLNPPRVEAWFVPAVCASVTFAFTNFSLVAFGIAIQGRLSVWRTWLSFLQDCLKSIPALTLLGIVVAVLVAVAGLPYLLLLVMPFAVSWRTFRVYQQQEEAYFGTVRSLVAALEAKDPYTRGHAERVAEYAKYVGEAAGLSESEVKDIEWAALLHDIGKIAVSCKTLTKSGALSDGEYSALREHPDVAASILQEVGFLEGIVPLVTAHHERIDGKGYPLGLGTDQIPVGARVLAVADVFDAITSERSYRPALGVDAALDELHSAAGTQLDERFVGILAAGIADGSISIDTAWVRPEGGDACG